MINRPKMRAYKFLLDNFSKNRPDLQGVIMALEKDGYEIIPYLKADISKDVMLLAQKMNAENLIKEKDCVFCVKSGIKIIFINDSMTDSDKFIVLLHELGHANDRDIGSVFRTKVQTEDFANEFSHYLRCPGAGFLFLLKLIKYKTVIFIAFIMLISGIFGYGALKKTDFKPASSAGSTVSDDFFYVTPKGEKYHRSTCRHIKNNPDIHKIPKNDTDILSLYKPCRDCIGE